MIDVSMIPIQYQSYVQFLKKSCVQYKISFRECNTHALPKEIAKEYGIIDTQAPELLEILDSLKCDDVLEIVENAYDKTFPHCYGAFIGFCKPSTNNPLCCERCIL